MATQDYSWPPPLERQNAVVGEMQVPPTPSIERQAEATQSWRDLMQRQANKMKTAMVSPSKPNAKNREVAFPSNMWHMCNLVTLEPLQYFKKMTGEPVNNGIQVVRMSETQTVNADGTGFTPEYRPKYSFRLTIEELQAIVDKAPYLIKEQKDSTECPDYLVLCARRDYNQDVKDRQDAYNGIRMSPSSESSNGSRSLATKRAR